MYYSIIGLWIAGGLLALAILAILFSGIRVMIFGSQDYKKMGMFLLPFLIYVVAWLITDDYTQAGIATMLFMMATMALAILVTGFRTTFNF